MRSAESIRAALVAFLLALARPASGEDPIVPPRVVSEVPARYPDGVDGAALVVLEVVVEADGSVSDLRPVDGPEAFVKAALETVGGYRFSPATRAGKPLRSRIRVGVTFTPPEPAPPAVDAEREAAAAPAPPRPATPSAPASLDEVTIGGMRNPVQTPTEHRIGKADVRLLPGAFGDPYRAIEMLPGVVPTVSGLPYYYIRGAPPSAVGYYIDEVRVPYLFHFALGPGVIQPALVEEVSLHPAAFPGRYGRYAGAIVAGRTRDPADELRGEAQVRVFDAGAYVETPFAGGKGSAGVGGRYSYTAAIFSLFARDTTVDYRDYNARVSYQLSDRWRLTAFSFGSYDFASQVDQGVEEVLFASEFHRLDIRADHRGADGSTSRVATTFGFDRTRIEGARFAQDFVAGFRAWHRVPVRPDLDVEAGLDTTLDHYSGDLPSPFATFPGEYENALAFFSPRNDTATCAWATATWHPGQGSSSRGFELTGTMRGDIFSSDGVVAFAPSPRTSMRVPLGDKIAFLGAIGIANQPPAFSIPIPAVGYRRLPGGIGYGYQKSAGLEIELPYKFMTRAVGFHHTYVNLRDFARSGIDVDLDEPQPVPKSPAQAVGLELFVSRKLSERIGGFISYTLSRSSIGSTPVMKERVSPLDRTHVFQIGASVDLGRGYRAGARFLTYRGWPDEGGESVSTTAPTKRLVPFVRLDARLEKRWQWRKAGHISLILEVLNATATKEVVRRNCEPDIGATPVCKDDAIGPITVPSIGVEGAL